MAWQKRENIMLCQPLDDHLLARNWALAPALLVQPKLDGVRARAAYDTDGNPYLISSQGNIIEGVPHINLALRELVKHLDGARPCFDGEIYVHGAPFESIVSITSRFCSNLHDNYSLLEYHIFDLQEEKLINAEREQELAKIFLTASKHLTPELAPILRKVQTEVVRNNEEINNWLQRFVGAGYEGIIIRNPTAFYVKKRPFTILKWKPSKNDWYKVIGIEEAISSKGERLNIVGALHCQDRYGNDFKVGTGLGLDDIKRREIWEKRVQILETPHYAHVYYQNLTKYGVPRFGKFTTISITPNSGE